MVKNRKKKAQVTLEYIILITAIVVALIAFLPGTFKSTLTNTLDDVAAGMNKMAERLSNSYPTK